MGSVLSRRRPHILVLDGAREVLDLFRDLLEGEGYRVSLALSEAAGLELVKRLAPDLIVLDLVLGDGEGGRRLLWGLRGDPATAGTPVIVCTGAVRLLQRERERLAEEGVLVIEKPFDIDDLLGAVADRLPPKRAGFEPNGASRDRRSCAVSLN